MNGTVIRLHGDAGSLSASLDRPILPGDTRQPIPLGTSCDELLADFRSGNADFRTVGQHLMSALLQNREIRSALERALGASPSEANPIYFYVTQAAEDIPWEALANEETFLALDARWPIARMGSLGDPKPNRRDLVPPLRIMAFLSAAQVDATGEWNALWESVQSAPLPVELRVFVAQDELLETINRRDARHVTLSATYVPPGREVFQCIRAFMPNILHFFCHGRAETGFPWIELATRSGWETPSLEGSVRIERNDFASERFVQGTWLVVLNCCESAAGGASDGAGSMALSLVADGGFPAAAAMREAVTKEEAHLFCGGLYRSVFRLMDEAIDDGSEIEIEWARALYEPRKAISTLANTSSNHRWTIPVMYVSPDPFSVRRRAGVPPPNVGSPRAEGGAMAGRLELETQLLVLRQLAANPPPGTPLNVVDAYRACVAKLEDLLRAGPEQI